MSPVPVSCVNAVTAPANTQPIAQNAAVSRARYLPAPKESKHIPTAAQSFTRPLRRNPSSGSTAATAYTPPRHPAAISRRQKSFCPHSRALHARSPVSIAALSAKSASAQSRMRRSPSRSFWTKYSLRRAKKRSQFQKELRPLVRPVWLAFALSRWMKSARAQSGGCSFPPSAAAA